MKVKRLVQNFGGLLLIFVIHFESYRYSALAVIISAYINTKNKSIITKRFLVYLRTFIYKYKQ